MTTDKPPYWSQADGHGGLRVRVLCCGGCYREMRATYAQGNERLAICNRPNCDQGETVWQIPKDEGTPHVR